MKHYAHVAWQKLYRTYRDALIYWEQSATIHARAVTEQKAQEQEQGTDCELMVSRVKHRSTTTDLMPRFKKKWEHCRTRMHAAFA